jgi:SAM-dependent methyltransferase
LLARRRGELYRRGVADLIYSDSRLAAVYDGFEADRRDLDAYVELAVELGAQRVVDLGCGTGCLALRLAGLGRHVVGVDPAKSSVDVAKTKPGAEQVHWLVGDASAFPSDGEVDLVLMTGNAAQAVLTDDAWSCTLRHIHAALRPGGYFVFETRRPEQRGWRKWDDPPPVTVDVTGIGQVERRLELTNVELPLASFRFTYTFHADATTLVSDSTIRFRDRDELELKLCEVGFLIDEVRDAADRPGQEFVFLSHRI